MKDSELTTGLHPVKVLDTARLAANRAMVLWNLGAALRRLRKVCLSQNIVDRGNDGLNRPGLICVWRIWLG